MARGAAPSAPRDDHDAAHTQSKASKRRCVQSACIPCRKRKSKCDGGIPKCATCTAVYKTECFYDLESEGRRSKTTGSSAAGAGTKRDASIVAASNSDSSASADFIIDALRKLPEDHVYEFISHIRKDPRADLETLVNSWRNANLPPSASPEDQSLETDLSLLLGKPIVTPAGESCHFGHSASLGLVVEEENFSGGRIRSNRVHIERQGSTWTNVTNNLPFIEELLDLYFRWSHPFYVLFHRECFYNDFRTGRDKYCSSLLINAICAFACHLTDDPAGRTDPSNFRTAGDHFFIEARRLLFEDETPSLTTVQALCVLSLREASTGRDSSGFGYIGRCIRMCVELGLHLNNSASPALRLTPSEIEVRKITFWGCFTVDSVYSICVGRITQLPRAAITLDKPIFEDVIGLPEAYPGAPRLSAGNVTSTMFTSELTALAELVNDNNYMFYGPKERWTSARLLDCYKKYQNWYRRLPSALSIDETKKPEPYVLVLHMFYHTIIVHLFRPFLKVDLMHSDIRPRAICIEEANKVSQIIRMYRQIHSFRLAHLLIPHILFTICIVHLLYSKDNRTSYQNLVDGLQGLEDLHVCHYFGARSFRIIHTLAKTWSLPWPIELQYSKLIPNKPMDRSQGAVSPPNDPLMVPPNTISTTGNHIPTHMSYHPLGHPDRRESLSMFGEHARLQLGTHPATPRSGSVPTNQNMQSPILSHPPTYNNLPISGYSYPQPLSTVPSNATITTTSPTADAAETLFWNPIPGLPGPILPRNSYQVSTMGLDSVLQSSDMDTRLGRDGFKISEDWQSSHITGFSSRPTGGYQQVNQPANTYVHSGSPTYPQGPESVAFQQIAPAPRHSHAVANEGYDGSWYSHQMS